VQNLASKVGRVELGEQIRSRSSCAYGCKGAHPLLHIGIIWQNVFKCPIWASG
jgi:hypothetical protein